MDSFEELIESIQTGANGDQDLQMINITIAICMQSIMKVYKNNPSVSTQELKEKVIRSSIRMLGMDIHDLIKQMTLKKFNKELALMVLDSPEFQQVKEQYFKCQKKNQCLVCLLYQNGHEDILQRFDDFVDFNMMKHYEKLYLHYVQNGEEEDMNKLYNKFKDHHEFSHYNRKAKKNALDWLIEINGDDDDEMVGWVNRH